jgi:hypothetical protein
MRAAMCRSHGPPEVARAIFENPMLNGSTLRLDGGQRFAPK